MTNRVVTSRQPSGHIDRVLFFILALSMSVFAISPSVAASVPSAPQYVEAMAGQTQVAVTWEAPSSTGGESLNYTARVWTVPPPTSSPMFASCSTTGMGCIIGGLVTGTNYYVDVIASNGAGASGPSAMKPISPGNAGSPPSNVSATSDSSGRVTVRWTPPTAFGTGQFAWYTAEAFTGPEISAGAYVSYCTADPSSATTCFIGGLKLGTTYYVQVRTVSSLGSSYPSTPRFTVVAGAGTSAKPSASSTPTRSATPIPVVKLNAPQQVRGVLHGKSVQVYWKAPAAMVGKKVLSYQAAAYYAVGPLISTCKTKPTVFSCSIPIRNARSSILVEVTAWYSGGAKATSKVIVVRVPI